MLDSSADKLFQFVTHLSLPLPRQVRNQRSLDVERVIDATGTVWCMAALPSELWSAQDGGLVRWGGRLSDRARKLDAESGEIVPQCKGGKPLGQERGGSSDLQVDTGS